MFYVQFNALKCSRFRFPTQMSGITPNHIYISEKIKMFEDRGLLLGTTRRLMEFNDNVPIEKH